MEQFKAGLIENGLIEGQNSTIDYSFCRGPPPKLTPDQRREAIARRDAGKEKADGHRPQLQRQPLNDQPP
jgi:hypothetical protein